MSEVTEDLMSFLGDDIVVQTNEVEEVEEVVEETEEMEDATEELEETVNEDEAEDEDAEEDDGEEVDEDSGDETDTEEPEEFELTLEGESVRVTKEELTSGYMRQKDYLTKVSEAESKIEQMNKQEVELLRAQEVFSFSALKQLNEFEAAVEQEGGWLAMERNRDPSQVAQFKAIYQTVQNNAKLAESVQEEYKAKQQATFESDMLAVAKHLVKTVPGITKESFQQLDSYVLEQGLSEDFVRGIRDPKAWALIHKAMVYDKAQVKKIDEPDKQPKRVKKQGTVRKEQPATGRRSLDKKISALSKTHTNKEKNSALARDAIADLLRLD